MERSNVNIKFLLPVLCFICCLYGIYHYVNNQEKNMCEMTYMFESPEYLKIPLKYEVSQRFPRYNLFIYGEGKYFEELMDGKLSGVPVLFVPGNAGSHRQVRSLASVALRMGHSLHSPVHFNFFAIDFDEEISGLYGGTLKDQTEFVLVCVSHIKSLYFSNPKIILIGHSMGGAISKAVFSLPSFTPSDISLIMTLAAPQRHPVVASDSALVEFYSSIRDTWKYRLKKELVNIPIVSIGGGQRDILVRSDLTTNNFQHNSPIDVHALTSSIPGVWLSTDHLAIVWCKQLILTICRSLYDLTNKQTKQITTDAFEVESVLQHHYMSRSSGSYYPRAPSVPSSTFPTTGQWIEQESNSWRFSRTKVLSTIYLLVPFTASDSVLVVATGMVKRDWIFGCTKLSGTETKTCIEGDNLSENSEIIPSKSKKSERRLINLSSQELQKNRYSYILIYITPLDSQVDILGERYNGEQRTKHITLPSVYQRFFTSTPVRLMSVSLPEQSVFFNITVSQSYGVFESVEFQLETRLCRAGSVVGQGIIKTHIPWSNENSYYHIRTVLGGLTTIPMRAHLLPPPDHDRDVNLRLILDPECSVVLTAKFPIYIIASQFIKFYGIYIIGYTVSLLMALLAGQMFCFESSGSYLSFYKVFGYYPTYVSLVAVPSVLYHCLLSPDFSRFSFLPSADKVVLNDSGFFSTLFLRTLLYLCACGLILTFYTLFVIFLATVSKIFMWMSHRTILSLTVVPLEQSLRGRLKLSKELLVWCALLGAVSVVFCSSLGALLAFGTYFCQILSAHVRCKAEEERRGPGVVTASWTLPATFVILWSCVVCLTSPGLVAWGKSLEFSMHVPNDPYLLPCVLMIVSCSLVWQLPTPSFNRIGYKKASHAIHVIASFTTLYGIVSVYRHLYFICATFIIVCVQQTYAYFQGPLFLKYD